MRKEIFVNDNFYHVYNRGIEKRTIFLDERDYERFFIGLCLFNDSRSRDYDFSGITLRSLASCLVQKRKQLVDILHWCQMPNHFHLFLRQRQDKGISLFLHKLSTGYSKYFNKKYERKGRLFEGTFKAAQIEKDDYFSHLGVYITTNHLDLMIPGWKAKGVLNKNNLAECKDFLLRYKWSSFRDYFGNGIIPGSISKEVFYEVFGDSSKEFELLIDQYLLQGLSKEHEAKLRRYEIS